MKKLAVTDSTVNRDGSLRPAGYVLMEDNGQVSPGTPAYITTDEIPYGTKDYDKVMAAIADLKVRHSI